MNIGLIFIDGDSVAVRFTSDWDRIRNLDKSVDIEMLKALESELRQRLSRGRKDRDAVLTSLRQSCSNAVQFTVAKACLCTDPDRELQTLVGLYL